MHSKPLIAFVCVALAALPAFAHPGTNSGSYHHFLDSAAHAFSHPFTGADHLTAMVAVGAWSALTVRPVWRAPAAFVALLIAGALAGFSGLQLPGVEPMIAASVLVLGLLLALQKKMPWSAAAMLVGVFAFFHGAAHGYELAGDTGLAALGALAGMALGSALLHLTGMALGHSLLRRHRLLAGLGGAATAALGAAMLTRLT